MVRGIVMTRRTSAGRGRRERAGSGTESRDVSWWRMGDGWDDVLARATDSEAEFGVVAGLPCAGERQLDQAVDCKLSPCVVGAQADGQGNNLPMGAAWFTKGLAIGLEGRSLTQRRADGRNQPMAGGEQESRITSLLSPEVGCTVDDPWSMMRGGEISLPVSATRKGFGAGA